MVALAIGARDAVALKGLSHSLVTSRPWRVDGTSLVQFDRHAYMEKAVAYWKESPKLQMTLKAIAIVIVASFVIWGGIALLSALLTHPFLLVVGIAALIFNADGIKRKVNSLRADVPKVQMTADVSCVMFGLDAHLIEDGRCRFTRKQKGTRKLTPSSADRHHVRADQWPMNVAIAHEFPQQGEDSAWYVIEALRVRGPKGALWMADAVALFRGSPNKREQAHAVTGTFMKVIGKHAAEQSERAEAWPVAASAVGAMPKDMKLKDEMEVKCAELSKKSLEAVRQWSQELCNIRVTAVMAVNILINSQLAVVSVNTKDRVLPYTLYGKNGAVKPESSKKIDGVNPRCPTYFVYVRPNEGDRLVMTSADKEPELSAVIGVRDTPSS